MELLLCFAISNCTFHCDFSCRTPNCMSKCLIVDVSPNEDGAECIPTTVLVHTQEQDILYESLPSSDTITKTVLKGNVPVPPAQSTTSRTMLVRKNDRLQRVNLLTLNELTPSKEAVNICGILVKRMGIQHCPSGDYRCNILLVDETTNVPFHVSVFFHQASSYSIFRVLLLGLFDVVFGLPGFPFVYPCLAVQRQSEWHCIIEILGCYIV